MAKSKGHNAMPPKINLALAFCFADARVASLGEAQDTTKHDNEVRTPKTGTLDKVHQTLGRAIT